MNKPLTLALAVAVSACELGAGADYRDAVPRAEMVQMNVPGSAGQPLTGEGVTRQGLEGETAAFYQITRGVSVFVNGAGVAILDLVRDVTQYPASSVTQSSATWGPYTDALSPNTWQLTVTRNNENDFSYVLQGKAKSAPDTAYLTVLEGSHVVTGKALGHGTFLVDMDAAAKLPEHDPSNAGTAEYVYAHDSLDATLDVQAKFTQVIDHDTMQRVNAEYHYLSNDKTGGALDFQFQGNVDKATPALEDATLNSRWARNGAGRSDVKVKNGDIAAGTEATASECWDSTFASRYLVTSFDPGASWGNPSACGDFSAAQFSGLRL